MSDIPSARILVAEVRALLERSNPAAAAKLGLAEQMMWRERLKMPRAPTEAEKVDATTAARIRAYKRRNPKASVLQIALRFRTGVGRVSEALRGKR